MMVELDIQSELVISDLPLFTSTTASVEAPSSGPTSFLMELLLEVEDDDVDPELSVQYASKNEGLLSVNGSLGTRVRLCKHYIIF